MNNVIGMCGSFNTLTSTDVTLTTSQEKLTQTRHRYVNDPPLNRFLSAPKARKNRRARQCTQRLKKRFRHGPQVSHFFPPFSRSFGESPSAPVSALQILTKLLKDQRRSSEQLLANHIPTCFLLTFPKPCSPLPIQGKLLIQLRTTTR